MKNLSSFKSLLYKDCILQIRKSFSYKPENSISRYENGEREAGYNMLIKFADYFDVSIDYLLERTDNPKINR